MLKCASPECVGEIARAIAPDAAGERSSYLDAAVGSVELCLVAQQEPMDQLFVEILWSARPVKVNQAGQVIAGPAKQPVNTRELFVLHRKHGATTDTRLSLSSSHCPGCGAPEATAADNVCPFCATAFNDGAKEWILAGSRDTKTVNTAL